MSRSIAVSEYVQHKMSHTLRECVFGDIVYILSFLAMKNEDLSFSYK